MKRFIFTVITFTFVTINFAQKSEQIGGIKFYYPTWWTKVNVTIPDTFQTENQISKYVRKKYGTDVGTDSTWREALKCWALYYKKTNIIPVFIAHCYRKGDDYKHALQVYMACYRIANNQVEKDWYNCYLAYNIGRVYEKLNQKKKAIIWYKIGSKEEYLNHEDQAIPYYAGECKQLMTYLLNNKEHREFYSTE